MYICMYVCMYICIYVYKTRFSEFWWINVTTKRQFWSTSRSRYSRGASQQISTFSYVYDPNLFFRRMCMSDDCVSSRSGYFNLNMSISSLNRSLWIGIHSSWYDETGSSYLLVQLPTVTEEVYGNYNIFDSGSSVINSPSRSSIYSKATRRSRRILRDSDAYNSLLPHGGYDDHDTWRGGTLS